MNTNDTAETQTEPWMEQPRMHPTDKKFLLCIIGSLLIAVGLLTYRVASIHKKLAKLEAAKAVTDNNIAGLVGYINDMRQQTPSAAYSSRMANAITDLQQWRMLVEQRTNGVGK